jgi:membrane protease YdiL (CAAX protease family)
MTFKKNPILSFPLTRIVIGLTLCLGIGLAAMLGMQRILNLTSLPSSEKDPISGTVFAFLVCAVYILLYQRYENRKITELSTPKLPQHLAAGALLGAGLAAAATLIQYLTHVLTVIETRPFLPLLPTLWNIFVNATIAETLIIGVVFRIMEDWLGSYLALIVLFVIFFILHITAPGATPVSAGCVSMHTFLCCTAFIYTRSLWLPIAIHFAWDFSFAALYGASINGYTMDDSLLNTNTNGPDLISGGYFGPQGSIQAGLLCLFTGALLLQISRKQNLIIRPSFRKEP